MVSPAPSLKFHPVLGLAALVAACLSAAPAMAGGQNLSLGKRFSPNPVEVSGQAGGSVPVSQVVGTTTSATGECAGFTGSQPDHTLYLQSYFDSLNIQVSSAEDTAIAIKGPGGVWCNDDFQGKNPGISGQFLQGTYQVWVSTYAKNRTPNYTIRITENR
jgi:hypothetical protein